MLTFNVHLFLQTLLVGITGLFITEGELIKAVMAEVFGLGSATSQLMTKTLPFVVSALQMGFGLMGHLRTKDGHPIGRVKSLTGGKATEFHAEQGEDGDVDGGPGGSR